MWFLILPMTAQAIMNAGTNRVNAGAPRFFWRTLNPVWQLDRGATLGPVGLPTNGLHALLTTRLWCCTVSGRAIAQRDAYLAGPQRGA